MKPEYNSSNTRCKIYKTHYDFFTYLNIFEVDSGLLSTFNLCQSEFNYLNLRSYSWSTTIGMNTHYFTTILCSLIIATAFSSVSAQCVDYKVSSLSKSHQQNVFSVKVQNNCQEEVYFAVLAKKTDDQVHQLLKGQLKAGESIKHTAFGPFLSEPVGQHAVVDPADYWSARRSIDMYIQNAKELNALSTPVEYSKLVNSSDIVVNE